MRSASNDKSNFTKLPVSFVPLNFTSPGDEWAYGGTVVFPREQIHHRSPFDASVASTTTFNFLNPYYSTDDDHFNNNIIYYSPHSPLSYVSLRKRKRNKKNKKNLEVLVLFQKEFF